MEQARDFLIDRLGECTYPSPMQGTGFIDDRAHILLHSDLDTIRTYLDAGEEPPAWLDEEIPLPDLLPLQDDVDDIDLPPKAPAPSRETRIAALDWTQLQAEVAACRA